MVHLHSGPSVLCPDCLLPSPPCRATGTGLFRREPSNSAGGTFTHERNHLHGLLQRILILPPQLGETPSPPLEERAGEEVRYISYDMIFEAR